MASLTVSLAWRLYAWFAMLKHSVIIALVVRMKSNQLLRRGVKPLSEQEDEQGPPFVVVNHLARSIYVLSWSFLRTVVLTAVCRVLKTLQLD